MFECRGAISVNGCVQISIDAFIDEMNGEKILAQEEPEEIRILPQKKT